MGIKDEIKSEVQDIENIAVRLKKRDFSGNTGQAIRNSSYQLTTTFIAKIGSLFFTILIARMLLPELFGLYSLALSTIVLFVAFSDFGINTALLAFMSRHLGKGEESKAKSYYKHVLKYKIFILFLISLILAISSYFISNFYYHKPIFYALLAGALYIPTIGLTDFLVQSFLAENRFKMELIKELIFQIIRITLIPLIIIFCLGKISNQFLLFLIFISLSIGYFCATLFLYRKRYDSRFKKINSIELNKKEKEKLHKFILPLSVTALSGMFFGNIDMIMIGYFVAAEFIGYYQSALGLIGSASAIIAFSGTSLFPILSRLKGRRLEKGFERALKLILLIAVISAIFTFIFAELIIRVIYGINYLSATPLLRLFSLILISLPLTSLYGTFYISQGDTKTYTLLLLGSTLINIILNYILISSLLSKGMLAAVTGACIATIISRYLYLGGLIIFRKNKEFF